jgi:hypothetical protein
MGAPSCVSGVRGSSAGRGADVAARGDKPPIANCQRIVATRMQPSIRRRSWAPALKRVPVLYNQINCLIAKAFATADCGDTSSEQEQRARAAKIAIAANCSPSSLLAAPWCPSCGPGGGARE